MVGLKDSITAITLVALGTSLPDTFASKIAAKNANFVLLIYFIIVLNKGAREIARVIEVKEENKG